LTIDGEERPFYDDEGHENGDEAEEKEEESSSEDDNEGDQKKKKANGKKGRGEKAEMDPDHRLLLKNARPLLQSRNSAVRTHFLNISYFISPSPSFSLCHALMPLLFGRTLTLLSKINVSLMLMQCSFFVARW
jgi:hypothetical protein